MEVIILLVLLALGLLAAGGICGLVALALTRGTRERLNRLDSDMYDMKRQMAAGLPPTRVRTSGYPPHEAGRMSAAPGIVAATPVAGQPGRASGAGFQPRGAAPTPAPVSPGVQPYRPPPLPLWPEPLEVVVDESQPARVAGERREEKAMSNGTGRDVSGAESSAGAGTSGAGGPLPPMLKPAQPPVQPPRPPSPPPPPRGRDQSAEDSAWWDRVEERVGKRWIAWLGALVLFLAAGFFVKYAIDQGLITPAMRDVSGVAFGLVLTGVGARFAFRKMDALGQSLMGAGLAVLYVSLYAAYAQHGLIPREAAFGAMVLVSVMGMALAVRFDAIPVSVIAILGGFLTPVMVPSGQNARDVLFAYLLLLDLTVLGVALFKKWRALDVLAFAGTAALFVAWFGRFYAPEQVWATLGWLGAFYAVFLVLPFANHLRRAEAVTLERFVMALVNATGAYVVAHQILQPDYPHALGWCALGMSGAYVALAAVSRVRMPADRRSVFAFVALAVVFLTMSIPLHLGLNAITIAWAAEAAVLVYLGYKFSYLPVRLGGFAILVLAVVRLFARHWPLPADEPLMFWNTPFGVAVWVALACWAHAAVHEWHKGMSKGFERALKVLSAVAGGALVLFVADREIARWCGRWLETAAGEYRASCGATILWSAGALAALGAGTLWRSLPGRVVGAVALVVSAAYVVAGYQAAPPGALTALFGNFWFVASLAPVAAIAAHAAAFSRLPERFTDVERESGGPLFAVAAYALLAVVTAQLFGWRHGVEPWCWSGAAWSAGALACCVAGTLRRVATLRAAGLLALLVAAVCGVSAYSLGGAMTAGSVYLNLRFATALGGIAAAFVCCHVLSRGREEFEAADRSLLVPAVGLAGYLLMALVTAETFAWQEGMTRWYTTILAWSVGGAGLVAAGVRWPSKMLAAAGLAAFTVSIGIGMHAYDKALAPGYWVFVNERFGVDLAAALLVFASACMIWRSAGLMADRERKQLAGAVATVGAAALLVLLSIEPYLYCVRTIADEQTAKWSGQMALTVVWSVFAAATLAVGFRRKSRAIRFTALALFGATALKLALVDLAELEQLYRIISFFVMGVVLIAASYLYHRAEKRMQAGQ